MTNKEKIEEKVKEAEKENKDNSVMGICRKYKMLIIYCIVVLTVYIIRYLIIPNI